MAALYQGATSVVPIASQHSAVAAERRYPSRAAAGSSRLRNQFCRLRRDWSRAL